MIQISTGIDGFHPIDIAQGWVGLGPMALCQGTVMGSDAGPRWEK